MIYPIEHFRKSDMIETAALIRLLNNKQEKM